MMKQFHTIATVRVGRAFLQTEDGRCEDSMGPTTMRWAELEQDRLFLGKGRKCHCHPCPEAMCPPLNCPHEPCLPHAVAIE